MVSSAYRICSFVLSLLVVVPGNKRGSFSVLESHSLMLKSAKVYRFLLFSNFFAIFYIFYLGLSYFLLRCNVQLLFLFLGFDSQELL